jgi:ubiquinone/menaquinone biosynthesis C-methylase UbiE
LLQDIAHRIVSIPWVFDFVQKSLGLQEAYRHLEPRLVDTEGKIVLDVGAGTGNFAPLVRRSKIYLALDNDLEKLRGLQTKKVFGSQILGDATRICLGDKSVDYVLCIALAHHLTDAQLPILFNELARVVRVGLIFLDPLQYKTSRVSNLLWRYDRGSHPRSSDMLLAALQANFELEHIEQYKIYHHYLLCMGRPK